MTIVNNCDAVADALKYDVMALSEIGRALDLFSNVIIKWRVNGVVIATELVFDNCLLERFMGLSDDVLARLILNADEHVVFKGRREKGSMGQEEIYSYDVLDVNDVCIGTVTYTEHTRLNGLRHSYGLVQRDMNGRSIVDVWWE